MIHKGGISPAWELKYQDFEPYYTHAEKLYDVHAQQGEDPTEPPHSKPYPYPPVTHQPDMQEIADCIKELGYYPMHVIPFSLYPRSEIPLQAVAHQCGTCRFGSEPKTSVLDLNCRTHDVDNLYVVDSSFFPSNSGVNPTLTIIANALRVGDHLSERMK